MFSFVNIFTNISFVNNFCIFLHGLSWGLNDTVINMSKGLAGGYTLHPRVADETEPQDPSWLPSWRFRWEKRSQPWAWAHSLVRSQSDLRFTVSVTLRPLQRRWMAGAGALFFFEMIRTGTLQPPCSGSAQGESGTRVRSLPPSWGWVPLKASPKWGGRSIHSRLSSWWFWEHLWGVSRC